MKLLNFSTKAFILTSLFVNSLIASDYRIPDLIPRPPPLPFVEKPKQEIDEKNISRLEAIENPTAEEIYELALYQILAGNYNQAKPLLEKAIELKPHFLEAYLELGFLYLWEHEPKKASNYFYKALEIKKCDKRAILGLEEVGRTLDIDEAIFLYSTLLKCDPKNADLNLILANRLIQKGRLEEAKQIYIELITFYNNQEAVVQLARVYNSEQDIASLEDLYEKNPKNLEVRLILAKVVTNQEKYTLAKSLYQGLPKTEQYYKQLYEIKSRTDVALSPDATYTDAKEWDPTINLPVVKDYYFLGNVRCFIPIFDKWRLDNRVFVYHQRENQIYQPIGVNYNVYEGGGEVKSRYFFAKDWKYDVILRLFRAWGQTQNVRYPFQYTTRFEPGILFSLNSEHLFVADVHVESFFIKNYSIDVSQLLRTDYVQGTYGYRPDIYMHPIVEGLAGAVYFHDNYNNIKNKQYLKGGFDLFTSLLKTFYLFEHNTFKYLNENYFSYKMQTRSTIEVKFIKEIKDRFLLELFWDHTWELTKQLYLPIGDTVYIADRLFLIWDIYTAKFTYRHKDRLKIELGGHYLYNTLIYWDWNLKGAITWQF